MASCQICGKHPSFGNRTARLGRKAAKRRVRGRTRRRFSPNVRRVRVMVDGTARRLNVCASCIKAGRVQKPLQA